MKTDWRAYYYDGKTAERHEVEVKVSPGGLVVSKDGASATWPLKETTQTQGFSEGVPVRLERGGEALVVSEPGFIDALREVAGKNASKFKRPWKAKRSLYVIPAVVLLTVFVVAGTYYWAIPATVELAAAKVPPSVEDRMGRSFVKSLTDVVPECESPELEDSVEKILHRLEAAAPTNPYEFKVYILDTPAENAFASPGGHIVIFSGLIESTKTPEELAGVMAHEMQHVTRRHSTRGMLQNFSTGLLLAAAFGDFQGVTRAAGTLGSLSYGRELEEEADRLGTELLVESRTDPQGFISFFERLWECECKNKEKGGTNVFSYLSTHPSTGERIENVKAHLKSLPRSEPEPLLPGVDWKEVRSSCSEQSG